MTEYLRVSQVVANMRVLGYGEHRAGVWTQGCTVGCPGCTSIHTHDGKGGRMLPVRAILQWLTTLAISPCGLTVSGGEPSEQAGAVLELITGFRSLFPDGDVLMYSGLIWRRLSRLHPRLVAACDVVIAGPYVRALEPAPLRGSSNQTVHLLTSVAKERYATLASWPVHAIQVYATSSAIHGLGIPETSALESRLEEAGAFEMDSLSWRSTSISENDPQGSINIEPGAKPSSTPK